MSDLAFLAAMVVAVVVSMGTAIHLGERWVDSYFKIADNKALNRGPIAESTEALNYALSHRDLDAPEPKKWSWGRDYGVDLLADINQLAHWRGTDALTRDCLRRAYKEISRLRKSAAPQT